MKDRLGALLLASSLLAGRAHADTQSTAKCVANLSDEEVSRSLADVDESFARQRLGAALWWTGWTAFNVVNIGLGSERYLHAERRLARDNWLVSLIGAGIFVTEVSVLPLPGLYAHRRFSRIPQLTATQRRHKLAKGLALLDKAALVEETNSNLTAHVASVVYASLSTGYVWIRNAHAPPGRLALALSLQLATSIAFGELTLWTVPRRARRDQRALREVCTTEPHRPLINSLSLRLYPGQVALSAHF